MSTAAWRLSVATWQISCGCCLVAQALGSPIGLTGRQPELLQHVDTSEWSLHVKKDSRVAGKGGSPGRCPCERMLVVCTWTSLKLFATYNFPQQVHWDLL